MSESTPINPRKAWGVTAMIVLGVLTIFGGFILSNLVTVIMIAIPFGVAAIGSRNKVVNIGWITVIVIAVELLTLATGVLDPLKTRISQFGNEVQCLSAVILIVWAIIANGPRIAKSIGIPNGTKEAMAEALKQGAKEAEDWLRK